MKLTLDQDLNEQVEINSLEAWEERQEELRLETEQHSEEKRIEGELALEKEER